MINLHKGVKDDKNCGCEKINETVLVNMSVRGRLSLLIILFTIVIKYANVFVRGRYKYIHNQQRKEKERTEEDANEKDT